MATVAVGVPVPDRDKYVCELYTGLCEAQYILLSIGCSYAEPDDGAQVYRISPMYGFYGREKDSPHVEFTLSKVEIETAPDAVLKNKWQVAIANLWHKAATGTDEAPYGEHPEYLATVAT